MQTTSPHVERFLIRVDAHLHTLPSDAERAKFLNGQIGQWETRYRVFQDLAARNKPTHPDGDAFDYLETIVGLSARLPQR